MSNSTDYEQVMGNWVRDRCRKRAQVYGKEMPDKVKEFLTTGGAGGAPEGNTAAPPEVVEWVKKTIEDPDWPMPIPEKVIG